VRANRFLLGLVLVSLFGGCATGPRPSTSLIERADRLLAQGQYQAAIRVYDELLATYPSDPVAPRAQATRDTLGTLLAARADVVRLKEELAARDTDLGRLKQELQRLHTDTESLRADLEELKRIDLKQERRRR
jgi:tetratricopeptide (TPR) repeat protein